MKNSILLLAVLILLPFSVSGSASAQAVDCSEYDVWIWAQAVYETDTTTYANLDPDGNGLACEHLPFVGFSPVPTVIAKPKNIFSVSDLKVKEAGKLTVKWEGKTKSVLLHETSSLLTPAGDYACGTSQSLAFMKWVLSWVNPTDIYIEPNYGTMDDYDEHQSYVWMEIAGDWYMLNEVMIRSGWASYSDAGSNHLHQEDLQRAEAFAADHMLGVHLTCGGTNLSTASQLSTEQITHAASVQPDRGQFADPANYYTAFFSQQGPHTEQAVATRSDRKSGNTSETRPNDVTSGQAVQSAGIVNNSGASNPQPAQETWQEPAPPAQETWEEPAQPVQEVPPPVTNDCHPAYGVCLPIVGDLNCGDIGHKNFWADPSDPYGLDRDGDGVACES